MYQTEDREGNRGVTLTKDIVKVAAIALQKNLQLLGPHVLPYSEQIKSPPLPFPLFLPHAKTPILPSDRDLQSEGYLTKF